MAGDQVLSGVGDIQRHDLVLANLSFAVLEEGILEVLCGRIEVTREDLEALGVEFLAY